MAWSISCACCINMTAVITSLYILMVTINTGFVGSVPVPDSHAKTADTAESHLAELSKEQRRLPDGIDRSFVTQIPLSYESPATSYYDNRFVENHEEHRPTTTPSDERLSEDGSALEMKHVPVSMIPKIALGSVRQREELERQISGKDQERSDWTPGRSNIDGQSEIYNTPFDFTLDDIKNAAFQPNKDTGMQGTTFDPYMLRTTSLKPKLANNPWLSQQMDFADFENHEHTGNVNNTEQYPIFRDSLLDVFDNFHDAPRGNVVRFLQFMIFPKLDRKIVQAILNLVPLDQNNAQSTPARTADKRSPDPQLSNARVSFPPKSDSNSAITSPYLLLTPFMDSNMLSGGDFGPMLKRGQYSSLKRGTQRCNYRRVSLKMLLEFFLTGKMCGSHIVRMRFGMGKR